MAQNRSPGSDTQNAPSNERFATRPLRLLVVLSLLLPAIILSIAGWISYRQHFHDARDRLERDLNRVYEHALKVFETFDLSARYVDELVKGMSDADIRAHENELSAALQSLTQRMPQLRDIWIVNAEGKPLVSGTVMPMPDMDVSDRDYFSVHKDGLVAHHYISDLLEARKADLRFFAISRKRVGLEGEFAGVTVISISPDYFSAYYSTLPPPGIASLVRSDGYVLARFPPLKTNAPARLPADAPFMRAIRANPKSGYVEGISTIDNERRSFAYRQLPHYDLYVTAGLDHTAVIHTWLWDMSSHLAFGFPATLALFALSLTALRRTQRATRTYTLLRQEVSRRELTERALRQSQKMEAVGRLTGGIAHDFNNLLTAILGNVDLALRRAPEDDQRVRRLLNSARQASERAATLVQRLLAYSRQHPLEVKAVDINKLVQGMSELLRRTIGETITVETVLAGGLWRAAIDPNQLENTILNLGINARDAMPEGGRLTIETANTYLDETYAIQSAGEVARGQYVLVAVTDSGTGMSKDVIERAFEPFFTTKPSGVGTGLGLSMVYGFVKQSGGHIKIYSELGEGTSIKLYFPRLDENSDLPDWTPSEIDRSRENIEDLGESILLVEDDDEVNRFATEVLRDEGYNVIATHDGNSALRLLDTNPNIKMLFTDVILPGGMNGRQLADEALRRRPDLKVLYATGYTRNAIIHDGRLDANVELLTKPFTPDLLLKKIRQVLDTGTTSSETEGA